MSHRICRWFNKGHFAIEALKELLCIFARDDVSRGGRKNVYIDYFIESATYRFLFTSCKTVNGLNPGVSVVCVVSSSG